MCNFSGIFGNFFLFFLSNHFSTFRKQKSFYHCALAAWPRENLIQAAVRTWKSHKQNSSCEMDTTVLEFM